MDTTTGDDGTAGLVPLPRTLRPLGVLEDEAGSKLTAAGVFKNKVKWNRDLDTSPPLALGCAAHCPECPESAPKELMHGCTRVNSMDFHTMDLN